MKSLLLADDEVAISSAFAKTLEGFGYRVALSQTLESALRSAAQGHFDAILVEFNLRSELGSRYRAGNGLQLVRKLRAAHVKVPIVVFTAMEGKLYEMASRNTGADDFIRKTTSIPLIATRLRAYFDR
jgi:DNA-binding response OmpR family regulator